MQEKPLRQILGFFWSVTAASHIRIQRIPVDSAELAKRRLKSRNVALRGEQHHTPLSRMKSVLVVAQRAMVRLQFWPPKALVTTFIGNSEAQPFRGAA